jgi:Taurine catabolism dioxygenase TauD, TfdA family
MAPALTENPQPVPHTMPGDFKAIFPDGIKTSGQHPPLYDLLESYETFPKNIQGPTVWEAKDFVNDPERWVHRFTPKEIDELSRTSDTFMASGTPLTGISTENFPLSTLEPLLQSVRAELLRGRGFILFKGFPVQQWGNHKSAVAYMGLGAHLGYLVSQNGRGHILGHVKDLGEDATQIDKVRIYRTNARQFFHADDSDIVGLLCIARALEGGESDIISSHHVFNVLQKERPDVLKTLVEPIWYFDRKGETSEGEEPYIRAPIFYLEPGGQRRVYSKWVFTPNRYPTVFPR